MSDFLLSDRFGWILFAANLACVVLNTALMINHPNPWSAFGMGMGLIGSVAVGTSLIP